MHKLVLFVALAVSSALFIPHAAQAQTRLVCKHGWHRGHWVRKCWHVTPHRHHHHHHRRSRPGYV
ncbi:hypothetical protein [Trinickia fusca]|nr:hypothetical protein [Trinickia fusca]